MGMGKKRASPSWRNAVKELRERGPVTQDEIAYSDMASLREHGVFSLLLKTSPPTLGYGQQTPVYYLPDEHSKEQVVRKYIETNPELVTDKSKTQLVMMFKKAGPEFKQAAQNVAGEYELRNHSDTGQYTVVTHNCPYCGETVSRMPSHLREDCPEV